MFTGIIEAVGAITGVEPRGDLTTLEIEAPAIAEGLAIGDSVAVNGGCLTVAHRDGDRIRFEAVRETLERTALGDLRVGARVNLERALLAGGRFDGHIVQGHVDGTGRVRRLERDGDDVRLFVDCEPEIAELLVDKGSVAVDGVSLTVVGATAAGFDVALIPHTLAATTLGALKAGALVNLEIDLVARYVERLNSFAARA